MSGDYSRERFDPRAHFGGVLMQQGRVQLDSDWNELVRIVDRRWRAETVDLVSFGPDPNIQGVAIVPRQTPDAFKIGVAAGKITIGRGRMYVDGLLAENHGAGALEFDRLLAEERGTVDVAFTAQPYHPKPTALPASGNGLAYLDVWEREVTHYQHPELVESALAVDTTTRLQTVWQVRFLGGIGNGVTCSTPDASIPGWTNLIRPSAGRLTTKAVGVAPEDDPCELPPIGGYRGLENQLYRLEVHDGGAVGAATFKWSRNNATVTAAVTEVVSNDELRVDSFGRDSFLRINTGDWVEITDDWRELSGVSGDPAQRKGEIRKAVVHEDSLTISFAPPLPADLIPIGTGENTVEARHLRVRLWDQQGKVFRKDGTEFFNLDDTATSKGVILVPPSTTTLTLEAGIEITFSLAPSNGVFRTGDYWLFAARTADASVEELDAAPPLGVHHHFARLGVVTLPGSASDCRILWPPEAGDHGCDCTVCLTPEIMASDPNALQKAVDIAGEIGGSVCLSAGKYVLKDVVQLAKLKSLTIRGAGVGTEIITGGGAFKLDLCNQVTIRDLAIESKGKEAAINIHASSGVRLERIAVEIKSESPDIPAVALSGMIERFELRHSWLEAGTGVAGFDPKNDKGAALKTFGIYIEDNLLKCAAFGVNLNDAQHLEVVRVARNLVAPAEGAGITLVGPAHPHASIEVLGNKLGVVGNAIVAGGDGLRIEGNDIQAFKEGTGLNGIVLSKGPYPLKLNRVLVLANRVTGMAGAGISIQAPVMSGMIKHNIIEGTAAGIVFAEGGGANSLTVENNQVLNLTTKETDKSMAPVGIRVFNTRIATIVNNTVRGVGLKSVEGPPRAGIQVIACKEVRIAGNDVSDVGAEGEFIGPAVGVHVLQPFAAVSLDGNAVRREVSEPNTQAAWSAIVIGQDKEGGVIKLDEQFLGVKIDNKTVSWVSGGKYVTGAPLDERVDLRGNVVEGASRAPGVFVATSGEIMITDNRCTHLSAEPAMLVTADFAVVSANRVMGANESVILHVDPKRSTVVANITRQPINMNGQLQPPWTPLNVVA